MRVVWELYQCGWESTSSRHQKPNELGIYDMSRNVSEWCSDSYRKYGKEESKPKISLYNDAPGFGNFVVLRWEIRTRDISYLRVSSRIGDDPGWCEDFMDSGLYCNNKK